MRTKSGEKHTPYGKKKKIPPCQIHELDSIFHERKVSLENIFIAT